MATKSADWTSALAVLTAKSLRRLDTMRCALPNFLMALRRFLEPLVLRETRFCDALELLQLS
jgi:hypothetical protein